MEENIKEAVNAYEPSSKQSVNYQNLNIKLHTRTLKSHDLISNSRLLTPDL